MSQTLESKLACVQTVHFLSCDLKAEGNKHWNSQKQTNKKSFFFIVYNVYNLPRKKNKSIVIFFFSQERKKGYTEESLYFKQQKTNVHNLP